MHQIFYIDIDEEITSVISRLRKSKAKENIFVIPRRGLILQSVVNLKLLKNEADKSKKQIMIITQDEQGRALSEKLGILSQESLDGIEESEEIREEIKPRILSDEKNGFRSGVSENSKNMESIGSDSFFNSTESIAETEEITKVIPKKERKITKKTKSQASMSDIVQSKKEVVSRKPKVAVEQSDDHAENIFSEIEGRQAYEKNMDSSREKELKNFFKDNEVASVKEGKNISGKSKKILGVFMLVCFALVVVVGVVLFYPKANIKVQLNSRTQALDIDAKADIYAKDMDLAGKIMPARVMEKEKSKTSTFSASGQGEISNEKARGSVTIYNEYSAAPQPLVATTRLASADGKIFRLVKGVTVPGMSNVGGQMKPGVIEAEVVADQSGEEYNINPITFSIPGFKDSPKFEKFYAKSVKAMAGGGSKGDVVKKVSASDIEKAKNELRDGLKQEMVEEIGRELEPGEKLLDDLLTEELVVVNAPTIEKIGENFEMEGKLKVKVLIFSEKNLEKIIANKLNLAAGEKIVKIKIDYGQSSPDFNAGLANIKTYAQILIESEVDLGKLKSDLLGKRPDQLEEVLGNYLAVKGIEIEFYPDFLVKKIPAYGQRVNMEILPVDF